MTNILLQKGHVPLTRMLALDAMGESHQVGSDKTAEGRHSPDARTYSYRNQDIPRSGARPAASRPARNSVRAASAISWRTTPPPPTGQSKKLFYSFSSSVASSDDDSVCRSSNPDSDKTRCVACRCSQTLPLAAELPRGCVAGVLAFSVFHSSSHFTTHASRRKGVLPDAYGCSIVRSLRRLNCPSPPPAQLRLG